MITRLGCNLSSGSYTVAQVLELSLPALCTAEYCDNDGVSKLYYGPFTIFKDCNLTIKCSNGESLQLSLKFIKDTPSKKGSIFIIGGADKCAEIHEHMITSAGGRSVAKVAFLPCSSANPYASGMDRMVRFRDLGGLNVDFSLVPKQENKLDFSSLSNNSSFWIVPVAIVDDEYTSDDPDDDPKSTITDEGLFPDINEKKWSENGFCRNIAEKIRDDQFNLFFFSGGNQVRYIRSLVYPDGSDGPLLGMIRYLFEYRGAVIGGTSAGGAVLSKTMISGGSSAGAWMQGHIFESLSDEINSPEELPLNRDDDFRLVLGQGLGFLPAGVISDTHFIVRGRVGRIMKACSVLKLALKSNILGIGVGENSAVEFKENSIIAIGERGTMIVEARMEDVENEFLVHYIEQDDTLVLSPSDIGFSVESLCSNRNSCKPTLSFTNQPETDIFGRFKFRDTIFRHLFQNENSIVFGLCLNDKLSDSYDEIPPRELEDGKTLLLIITGNEAKCFAGKITTHWFGAKDRDYPAVQKLENHESYSFFNVRTKATLVSVDKIPDMRYADRVSNIENGRESQWLREFEDRKQFQIGVLALREGLNLMVSSFFYDFAYNDFDVVRTSPAPEIKFYIDNKEAGISNKNGFCTFPISADTTELYGRFEGESEREIIINLNFNEAILAFSV